MKVFLSVIARRHSRRGNPALQLAEQLDCFALLAMTENMQSNGS